MSAAVRVDISSPDAAPYPIEASLEDGVWLGRDPNCGIRLPSAEVSRYHAYLDSSDGDLVLHDRSANGTLVGGRLVRQASVRLRSGSELLKIGPFSLQLEACGATSARIDVQKAPGASRQRKASAYSAEPEAEDLGLAAPRQREPSILMLPESAGPAAGVRAPDAWSEEAPPSDSQRRPRGRALGAPGAPRRPTPAVQKAPFEPLSPEQRRSILSELLEEVQLPPASAPATEDEQLRADARDALQRIVDRELPQLETAERRALAQELLEEALGLGPLESLLSDADISEIMVVGPHTIYVERGGRVELSRSRFTDEAALRAVIERIVTPLGRRIDESSPVADARLSDGSRVHAILPPLSLVGPCLTIRKFPTRRLTLEDLVQRGCLSESMARFLQACVRAGKNILVSGGTGSGKTTLLNCLSGSIPDDERIITIEDAAELQLVQPHVVSLEARPPNLEGQGAFPIRQLVHSALRMRPDRIVVGECRGGEALDRLQAMTTGHDGSMTTLHANNPEGALLRLETLCLTAGAELPQSAIRSQISSSLDVIVQLKRVDGARRVVSIAEVGDLETSSHPAVRELFSYLGDSAGDSGGEAEEQSAAADGRQPPGFLASGFLPSFAGDLEDDSLWD